MFVTFITLKLCISPTYAEVQHLSLKSLSSTISETRDRAFLSAHGRVVQYASMTEL